jgi:hypothetical protein
MNTVKLIDTHLQLFPQTYTLTYKSWLLCSSILSNFTELSPASEATNYAATQEVLKILWNPKVHYRVHNSTPLVPILRHITAVHTNPFYQIQ